MFLRCASSSDSVRKIRYHFYHCAKRNRGARPRQLCQSAHRVGAAPVRQRRAPRPPRYMAKPPVSRLEWDPVVKDFIDNLDGNPLEIDKREKKGVK